MKKLSHFDAAGSPRMVDVSAKSETRRTARAHAFVSMRPAVLRSLPKNPKGNPLEIARIAGIAAAKKASDLIPLCHPLMLSHADVEVHVEKKGVRIVATATTTAQTGVEMEALTAAVVAALTVYDMTKALDKSIEIQDLYLLEKTGGKSGEYRRQAENKIRHCTPPSLPAALQPGVHAIQAPRQFRAKQGRMWDIDQVLGNLPNVFLGGHPA